MCLGMYLCTAARLDQAELGRRSRILALAPEPAPWPVLSVSCVVAARRGGCLFCGPAASVDPAARARAALAARDLRRIIDAAAKAGAAALLVYRQGDEDKTPEESSVADAAWFGDDGAWLAAAVRGPKLYWIGAPARRLES